MSFKTNSFLIYLCMHAYQNYYQKAVVCREKGSALLVLFDFVFWKCSVTVSTFCVLIYYIFSFIFGCVYSSKFASMHKPTVGTNYFFLFFIFNWFLNIILLVCIIFLFLFFVHMIFKWFTSCHKCMVLCNQLL